MTTAVYRFRVTGRVQGVAFRAHTRETARSLGVDGWVANHRDGSVIGVAAADDAVLARFRDWLDGGPPAARVDTLEWEPTDAAPPEPGFAIRPDAGA